MVEVEPPTQTVLALESSLSFHTVPISGVVNQTFARLNLKSTILGTHDLPIKVLNCRQQRQIALQRKGINQQQQLGPAEEMLTTCHP